MNLSPVPGIVDLMRVQREPSGSHLVFLIVSHLRDEPDEASTFAMAGDEGFSQAPSAAWLHECL